MSLLLSCREVAEVMSDYSESRLPASLQLRVRLHLSFCRACAVLHSTLDITPRVCRELLSGPVGEVPAPARQALLLALTHLDRPRSGPGFEVDPLPGCLGEASDRPLEALRLTREALAAGHCPTSAPFLAPEVLALLPDPQQWTWSEHPNSRSAVLLEEQGLRLILLQALPGYQQPEHLHEGTESILVLDGHLEDGDGLYQRGRWIHHLEGSSHAPAALGGGCWCLIREEGRTRSRGIFSRGRKPLAA
nr:cupin domain-containing protein [uncultured Holophaga sp.]